MAGQLRQNGEVVAAAVNEYVVLYLVVPMVGIVVQIGQTLLGVLGETDVFRHALTVLPQRPQYVDSQGQTYVPVYSCTLVKHATAHLVQTHHKTVVAGYLAVKLLYYVAERGYGALEVVIHLRGLMTGVCQVEHIVRLLTVQH